MLPLQIQHIRESDRYQWAVNHFVDQTWYNDTWLPRKTDFIKETKAAEEAAAAAINDDDDDVEEQSFEDEGEELADIQEGPVNRRADNEQEITDDDDFQSNRKRKRTGKTVPIEDPFETADNEGNEPKSKRKRTDAPTCKYIQTTFRIRVTTGNPCSVLAAFTFMPSNLILLQFSTSVLCSLPLQQHPTKVPQGSPATNYGIRPLHPTSPHRNLNHRVSTSIELLLLQLN